MIYEMLQGLAAISVIWILGGLGLLHAFWPINDKETSMIHRIVTCVSTVIIIVYLCRWILK